MNGLASQFSRDGNHNAANTFFTGANPIPGQHSKKMDLLPIIAPGHATLLSESQRQRLLTQLSESHGCLPNVTAVRARPQFDPFDDCYCRQDWQ